MPQQGWCRKTSAFLLAPFATGGEAWAKINIGLFEIISTVVGGEETGLFGDQVD